jgi:parvulin-like peptidyl-prolyl isomerase
MAVKAKTKTVKTTKKLSPVLAPKAQPLSIKTNSLNLSLILKHKKISGGIVIAVVVIVLLVVLFKSVFIAAIVNGEPISRLSVVSALEKQGGKAMLDSLITKKLILQEAKKRNITVAQNDIDAEIKKITANLQTQGSTLDQALASQGMTKADLNDEVEVQVAVNKMVGSDVAVTSQEIDAFVAANKSQMAAGTTDAQFREEAIAQLKQQKLQTKTTDFVNSLQSKAKVLRFVSY